MSDKCPTCRRLADALAELLDAARPNMGRPDSTVEYAALDNAANNAATMLDSYATEVLHDH